MPSSEREHEKCIFRLSYFHRIEPSYKHHIYPIHTYYKTDALSQTTNTQYLGHVSVVHIISSLEISSWLKANDSVQTDLNLSDVWGEVGEEVAEGAVVAAVAELDQESCQHCQQAFSVLDHSLCEAEHGVCKCRKLYCRYCTGLTSCSVSML